VKDSGLGPTAAIQERLFEPFASEKPEGAGLGLFVAHQVAQAHGAEIRWQRLDDMTCFSIEIPLHGSDTDHGSPADC
jgi:nitrogen-specific signal transduction histidine kinase